MTSSLPITLARDVVLSDAEKWKALNIQTQGRDDWPPLTIKATYVFGVIHNICESVTRLLRFPDAWEVTYLPAFGICASGIELLGRCLTGYAQPSSGVKKNLTPGFNWLISSVIDDKNDSSVVVTTNIHAYTVANLVSLRHFSAHGQATVEHSKLDPFKYAFYGIHIELLDQFPSLIGNAMERYWSALQTDPLFCEKLANANVIPLQSLPIEKVWRYFVTSSIEDVFSQFNWHVSQ